MNNFREWLSDNLRYILLAIVILAVLIGLFFGVRALTRESGTGNGSDQESAGAVSAESSQNTDAASGTASGESAARDHGSLTENADADVSKLVSDYYTALGERDISKVRELTDTLPETEAAKIESSDTQYSDVKVYTKNGYDPGSYVVYASYEYTEENQPGPLPGLQQMYVKKGSDGAWKIIFGDLAEEESAYIKEVGEDADVQALISRVKSDYDNALKAAESSSSSAESGAETTSSSSGSAADGTSGSASASSEASGAGTSAENSDGNGSEETTTSGSGQGENGEGSNETIESSGNGKQTDESKNTQEEAVEEPEETYRDTTILSGCYVRSGPGYEYEVLAEVPKGTKATVIGDIDNGWWHVYAGGVYGYVGRDFIR